VRDNSWHPAYSESCPIIEFQPNEHVRWFCFLSNCQNIELYYTALVHLVCIESLCGRRGGRWKWRFRTGEIGSRPISPVVCFHPNDNAHSFQTNWTIPKSQQDLFVSSSLFLSVGWQFFLQVKINHPDARCKYLWVFWPIVSSRTELDSVDLKPWGGTALSSGIDNRSDPNLSSVGLITPTWS